MLKKLPKLDINLPTLGKQHIDTIQTVYSIQSLLNLYICRTFSA